MKYELKTHFRVHTNGLWGLRKPVAQAACSWRPTASNRTNVLDEVTCGLCRRTKAFLKATTKQEQGANA